MPTTATHSNTHKSRRPGGEKKKETALSSQRDTRATRQGKVRKEFWIDPQLLKTVKEELGATTEREAVEMALDLVMFRKELTQGARRLTGLAIDSLDG